MKDKFSRIIATRTVKQSVLTSSATIVNGLLGIFFYILLGRFLGPQKFGIFSVVTLTLTLLADIANVGTDTGIVRFVGKYKHNNSLKALKFLKLGLKTKIIAGLVLLIIGWFTFPNIVINILGKAELAYPMRYALLGAIGVLLFSFTTSAIQAYEKFKTWGILNISLNALRLLGVIMLFYFERLDIYSSLQVYIFLPFVGFLVGSFFLPNYLVVKGEDTVWKEFFHYNKWIALFILLAAISTRFDTYLTTKLLTLKEVGIYSAAVSLSAIGSQIVSGIATVVAPKLASFETNTKAIKYLKNLQLFVSILGIIGVIIGLPLSNVLIPLLWGKEFQEAVKPFSLLLISQVIFLISIPVHTAVIYYFSKPALFVVISLVHLSIMGIGGWLLIANFGIMGAALTVLIGNVSNFLIPAFWVINKFKEK